MHQKLYIEVEFNVRYFQWYLPMTSNIMLCTSGQKCHKFWIRKSRLQSVNI